VELAVGAGFVGAEELEASLLVERPAPGDFVRIRVTDDGCGMDSETRRRMFDPFYSTK
jgi:signal transduction histidine kinase